VKRSPPSGRPGPAVEQPVESKRRTAPIDTASALAQTKGVPDAGRAGDAGRVSGSISARSIALGTAGAVVVVLFQIVSKAIPQTVALPLDSTPTIFPGVVLCLAALGLLNLGLRRWRPGAAFRPAEFAVVFAMVTVAASIGAQDEAQYLIPMLLYPFRHSVERDTRLLRPHIPEWYIPRDPAVVEPYYLGHINFWSRAIWPHWVVPLLVWTGWLLVLGVTMWAWNVILRRRWVEQDRLTFPSVQLPMEICRSAGFAGHLRGPFFLAGVAAAALCESLTQINRVLPIVPGVPTWFNASPTLDGAPRPWNALSPMSITWAPMYVGVCFFIPVDILFSSWFFYLLRKGMEVVGYSFGWRELGWDAKGFPYTRALASGSWIVIFLLLVWAERRHLMRVLRAGFSRSRGGGRQALSDADEPGSYRWAARLLVAGLVTLVLFSVYAGMSPGLTIAYYAFYWMLTVTMTRIYAQVGPPIEELYFIDPQRFLTTVFGTIGQAPGSLTLFSLLYWINRDHRGQPMAHQLAAFRVGQVSGAPPRAMGKVVLLGFAVGVVTCLLGYVHWAYRLGEDQWVSGGWGESAAPLAVARAREWILTPTGPDYREIGFMGVGAAITFALARLSTTIIGFPFHPIGFALATCFAVEYNWLAFAVAWGIKLILLRYGGRQLYQKLVPTFLGVILGGLLTPVAWGFIAWLFGWYS
jgi:hypothetical protein